MLYALAHPASLAVLLVSYVVGLTLHGVVQAAVARWRGDRRPAQEGRLKADPRVHIDPFGAVGALISGLGWVRPVELQRRRKEVIVWVSLAGPAVQLVLGVGLLLLWRLVSGPADVFASNLLDGAASFFLQRGETRAAQLTMSSGSDVLLVAGVSQVYLGALSLVPLPPLDGGRLLFGLAPRTQGWLRAEHHLVERNIGVAVLLALLLIPLGGPVPILPDLLDAVLNHVVRPLCGA